MKLYAEQEKIFLRNDRVNQKNIVSAQHSLLVSIWEKNIFTLPHSFTSSF